MSIMFERLGITDCPVLNRSDDRLREANGRPALSSPARPPGTAALRDDRTCLRRAGKRLKTLFTLRNKKN